jgi:hypothetical protein
VKLGNLLHSSVRHVSSSTGEDAPVFSGGEGGGEGLGWWAVAVHDRCAVPARNIKIDL